MWYYIEQKIIMKMIKKKGFKKQAGDKYRNLSKEEKDTISYGKKRYNMSEEKKRKTKRISKKLS